MNDQWMMMNFGIGVEVTKCLEVPRVPQEFHTTRCVKVQVEKLKAEALHGGVHRFRPWKRKSIEKLRCFLMFLHVSSCFLILDVSLCFGSRWHSCPSATSDGQTACEPERWHFSHRCFIQERKRRHMLPPDQWQRQTRQKQRERRKRRWKLKWKIKDV